LEESAGSVVSGTHPSFAQQAEDGLVVSHGLSANAPASVGRESHALRDAKNRSSVGTAHTASSSPQSDVVRNASASLQHTTPRTYTAPSSSSDAMGISALANQENTEAPRNFDEFRARFLKAAQDQKSSIEEPSEETRFSPLPSAQKNLPFLPSWGTHSSEHATETADTSNLLEKRTQQAERPEGVPVLDDANRGRVGFFSSLRYIGQFVQMHLIFEHQDRLILLDQHAAHERITYQKLLESFQSSQIPQQAYLIPPQIELGIVAAQQAEQFQEELERLGVSLEPFGGQSFVLRAVPIFLKEAEPLALISDLLEEVAKGYKSASLDQRRDGLLMRMACHGSVRGSHKLSHEEVRALLQQLDEIEFKGHCPHGRPIFFEMARTEIEKRFHRT
jgi:DNA mismatch repair ATPase MutL